jgi:uncharacterized membrane protein
MIPIAEIHPMLVHFPIVLWISAETIAVVVLLRGGDLSARQQWPVVALYSLLAGTAFAFIAALFGDIALDHAVAAGFAVGPMEVHETVAVITLSIFALHAALRLLAIWRRYPSGRYPWLAGRTARFGRHLRFAGDRVPRR